MKIALRYTLFALIATAGNIAAQELSVQLYAGAWAIILSILVGTFAGLAIKFVLDKNFIFYDTSDSLSQDGVKFIIYTAMGGITTVIFWGFEYGFHLAYQSKEMRYLGGIIGLAIGYYLKYQLDKRYVFTGIAKQEALS